MPEAQRFIADQIPARPCVGYAVELWLWKLPCDIVSGGEEVGMCRITTKPGEPSGLADISSNQSGDQLGDNKGADNAQTFRIQYPA
ncbi:hypothetical protein N7519_006496 [Penicillium mononematosum]|uniref:uncharacterized protein n=1 Tax=Penicillium mononematosum TaxID=268346 RepID=UPI0025478520|nr:uncharacterized protein N7519_006496 [Penicillium mononematosum]KAJ6185195.1 hypothetical protein N7519_006496 [Penicillium mononematosum]